MSRFGNRLRGNQPVSEWLRGGSLAVRSVQTGTIAIANGNASNTATITAVTVANSLLIPLGQSYDTVDTASSSYRGRLALTDATTITLTRAGTSNALTAGFLVVEFVPGVLKSVQEGTITLTGAASNTATISAVSASRYMLVNLGNTTTDTSGAGATFETRLTLTNATTITANRGSAVGNVTIAYRIVEF